MNVSVGRPRTGWWLGGLEVGIAISPVLHVSRLLAVNLMQLPRAKQYL